MAERSERTDGSSTTRIPLFPLSTVLFPGMPLPLHIFELRYRKLIADLTGGDPDPAAPPAFGVIAIREGREVGAEDLPALHPVGCTAVLRQVNELPDGRYDVLTVGARRFVLRGVDRRAAYLVGEVEFLPEPADGEAGAGAQAVAGAFRRYMKLLAAAATSGPGDLPDLPGDPTHLSYLVAAAMVLDLTERQQLLEAPDTPTRLRAELALLARERFILTRLPSVPGIDLTRGAVSLN